MNKMVVSEKEWDDWENLIRYAENVDPDWQTVRVQVTTPEIWEWALNNCNSRIKNWGNYFFFESESDKMAFTLVWV